MEVVVVGAGVAGLAAARALTDAGHKVTCSTEVAEPEGGSLPGSSPTAAGPMQQVRDPPCVRGVGFKRDPIARGAV